MVICEFVHPEHIIKGNFESHLTDCDKKKSFRYQLTHTHTPRDLDQIRHLNE